MNKIFAEWYRAVNLEPNSTLLENRWNGIESYIKESVSALEAFELIRLFYRLPVSSDFHENFTDVFTSTDSAFNRQAQPELAVLAGTTLFEMVERDLSLSNLIMLATLSMNFQDRSPAVPAIFQSILNQFNKKTASIREITIEPAKNSIPIPLNKSLLSSIETEGIEWSEDIRKPLHSYITSLGNYLIKTKKKDNDNLEIINIYSEDSQILWWMVGEWSNDLNVPFKNFYPINASIIAGKELADIIVNMPGPYSAQAVLNKVLEVCKKPKTNSQDELYSIIEGLDKGWSKSVIELYPPDDTKDITPILTAISKSIQVDGSKEWIPVFKKATALDPENLQISSEKLAFQVYLECLTIKYYNDIEE